MAHLSKQQQQQQQQQQIILYPEQTLGVGSYGKVCKALYGQLPCAAKLLHDTLFQYNDPGERVLSSKFEQECQFLSTIKHPNVVQYLTTARDKETRRPVLLMELMDESVTNFLGRSKVPLDFNLQVDICYDVALALSYLHSKSIIHRDLSSNNVLLIAGKRAKVTDFGISKLVDANPQMTPLTQVPGTLVYMPPEALTTPPVYTHKLDCFSYGVLTIQIASGNFPTPGKATELVDNPHYPTGRVIAIVPERERRARDIDLIQPHPPPTHQLALDCIKDRDKDRPSASEICKILASIKEGSGYRQRSQTNEGISSAYHLEEQLRRLGDEKSALQRELLAVKKQHQSDMQRVADSRDREQEAHRKLALAQDEVQNLRLTLRRLREEHRDLAAREDEVQDLRARIREDFNRKLATSEQEVRELRMRLQKMGDEKARLAGLLEQRDRDVAYHIDCEQQACDTLATRERQLLECSRREKELQGVVNARAQGYREEDRAYSQPRPYGYPAPDVDQRHPRGQLGKEEYNIHSAPRPTRSQSTSSSQHFPLPPAPQGTPPRASPITPSPPIAHPPIPEWREAKPPPDNEQLSRFTGQVAIHGRVAYFTKDYIIYAYHEPQDRWERLVTCENKDFGVAVINDKVTTVGGRNKAGVHTTAVLTLTGKKLDRVLPPMMTPRFHPATVTTPTHLVVAGGQYVSNYATKSWEGYKSVELMTLDTLQWSVAASLPNVVMIPQIKHATGHLLVSDTKNSHVYTCQVEKLLHSQNVGGEGEVWARKRDIPVAQGASLVSLQGRHILALGGMTNADKEAGTVYRYTIEQDKWEVVKELRTPRSWVLSVLCPDAVLVVVGGFKRGWDATRLTEKATMRL